MDRRRLLALAGGAAASLVATGGASAQNATSQAIQGTLGEGQRFNPASVVELARLLSKKAYTPPPSDLPEPFANLTYEQYIGIRAQPSAVLWGGEGRSFSIEPLHRGFAFQSAVQLFVVEDNAVRRVLYDRSRFDYGRLQAPANLPDLGFSGFRVFGDAQGGRTREVAIFQGATFFRSSARGQNLGVMARGLTLKAGDSKGEEFPFFRAFWIEQPGPQSEKLVIHALLDSESVCGAYRFTLRSGEVSIIDTEVTLFPRAAVENYGIGGMSSTFLFGPNDRRGVDDVRPAVFESSGLQIKNGNDEWLWRPLSNPDTLQISAFVDPSPRGFGLMQRERDYTAFLDDDQNFERRPSLWIEPIGEWGPGLVQLIEIPTDSEINDNVLCYWRPKQALAAGAEVSFAYRQFWCWQPPERPNLLQVGETRVGRGRNNAQRRFVIDFEGEALKSSQAILELKPALSASPGSVVNIRVWPYPERKMCRIGFDLDVGTETVSELRLVLEAAGKPISETWLYRWTP
ncbi:glucan biosynthesis protein [Alsobacter sp. SYSU M60028]|uniref:Glucan biosynthesis protein n=1 Tax=Alsobacter ponti TaxID=2962936 RepID=A0ABT1LD13_9HYPH|nr:glucan biosynthesis protein [Alsobacter ponti]MCP8939382.1 glucan biosynthesis protein [Alsobacter ponti]